MKTLRKATHLYGLAVVLVVGGITSSAADLAAEVAAIHAVDDVWVKAFNAGDADTMAAQYEEHAVLLPPGAPAAHGQAAIHAFFAKMVQAAAKDGLAFSLRTKPARSEEHTSELQSRGHLVCRLLLEKKKRHSHAHT